ncbi:MAG: 30S ribosomal protein S7 [Patescibacteria group bacterium]|nr:30S ribosomal protein S7 [Patescibacteria group bacterium]
MAKKKIVKQNIIPDPVYDSVLLSKFINKIMERGKKTVARKIVYQAFDIIKEKTKKDSLEVFDSAVKNASPVVEVKSKRVGGAVYQVPMEVKGNRKISLAMNWLITSAKSKKGRAMREKLAEELISASKGEGNAVKRKNDIHRMADANRAFAHFAR